MQDLEFTISQYLDGTLPPADRIALESHLASDAEARAMLDDYRRLDLAMKSMPKPAFHWNALAASISGAVDQYDEERARSYRMPAWVRKSIMPVALAASLLIVAGVGIQLFNSHSGQSGWPAPITPVQSTQSSTVVAFQTDKATGPVQEEIAIGPGAGFTSEPIKVNYEDAGGPSHVTVVSGVTPVHDSVPAPTYDME